MRRLLFAALLAAATLGSAQAQTQVSFLTNYVYNGRHSPFFVGLEKGYFKDAGFELKISPSTGSGFVVAAVDGGKAQFGMADAGSVVQAIAKGAKVRAFMIYADVTTNGLASLTPFPTPQSVIGKKIAAGPTDSVRVILPIIFGSNHLDPSGINWQSADPSVYFSLLMSGQVDLITATSDGDVPALTKVATAQNKTVNFASFAGWGYDVFGIVLVASGDMLGQHPEEAAHFVEATQKSVAYATAHPEEAAEIMVKYNPTMNKDTVLAQWRETMKSQATQYAQQHGYGVATEDRLQRTIDLTKTALKLEHAPTAAEFYTQVSKGAN